jgi:hypothetical protein
MDWAVWWVVLPAGFFGDSGLGALSAAGFLGRLDLGLVVFLARDFLAVPRVDFPAFFRDDLGVVVRATEAVPFFPLVILPAAVCSTSESNRGRLLKAPLGRVVLGFLVPEFCLALAMLRPFRIFCINGNMLSHSFNNSA